MYVGLVQSKSTCNNIIILNKRLSKLWEVISHHCIFDESLYCQITVKREQYSTYDHGRTLVWRDHIHCLEAASSGKPKRMFYNFMINYISYGMPLLFTPYQLFTASFRCNHTKAFQFEINLKWTLYSSNFNLWILYYNFLLKFKKETKHRHKKKYPTKLLKWHFAAELHA